MEITFGCYQFEKLKYIEFLICLSPQAILTDLGGISEHFGMYLQEIYIFCSIHLDCAEETLLLHQL